jgi:uroporphyrin-3 C-methyltransferase
LAEDHHQLASKLHEIKQQQNTVEQHIKTNADELQNANTQLEERINDFNKELKSVNQQMGTQDQDWLLLKARYFLELAQINAQWSNNPNELSTINLLEQADTLLTQINTPELFKIRQTIAKELLQLKANPNLDIPGLLSQLDAIQSGITTLTMLVPNPPSNASEEQTETTDYSWKKNVQKSLNQLSRLVIIKQNDEEIKTLSSPLYESILKESIRLNIQEAQWAILNDNATAYQFALKQALSTLKRGFNEHLSNTTALINQLTDLQKINITSEKNLVGQGLPLLNQLIKQKQVTKPIDKADKHGAPSL